MKTMLVLLAAFLLVGSLIVPARAQGGDQATVTFEITAASTPCPNTTYWAAYGLPASEFVAHQLTDGDGNGVYTGSVEAEVGGQLTIQLVQGTGAQESIYGPIPGNPSATIKNVGFVTITEDTVFSGQAAGCPTALPRAGSNDDLPVVPLVGGALLAAGVYLQRRTWLRARA
jgi:hypothetical protein